MNIMRMTFHDQVPEVRTKDDTILTVKLMLFFELIDVERMLDNTHDPIGKICSVHFIQPLIFCLFGKAV